MNSNKPLDLKINTKLVNFLLAAMVAFPVVAVSETEKKARTLEEITVIARRVEERLEDVPASVSVLTEDALRRSGVASVEGVVNLTPGVSMVTKTAEVGDTQINIRGINGARDAESNVALVVDGILKTNTAQIAQMHGKLVQVEVLKGPQGAYYGRNAAAGAFVLSTKKPGEEMIVDVSAKLGENSVQGFTTIIEGPISDNAGIVLYGDHFESDGHYRNTSPVANAQGATVDAVDNNTVGARLIIAPSDQKEFDIKARYAKFSGSALSFNPVFNLPSFAAALGNPLFDEDVNDHKYDFIGNIKPENIQETKELSVKGTWDFDSYSLTSWALYSDLDQQWIADSTAASFYRFELQPSCRETTAELLSAGYQLPSPQVLLPDVFTSVFGPFGPTTCDGTQFQARSQRDVSAEIRLTHDGDNMSWSLGAYYLSIDRDTSVSIAEDQGRGPVLRAYNPPESKNPTSLMFADSFKTNVYAVFGGVEYDIAQDLKLSAALRYDREERDVSSRVPNVLDPATGAPINPGLPAQGMMPDASNSYDEWQPKISLARSVNDNWNVYGNWGVGFKAGGFNSQGSAAVLQNNFNTPLGSGININDQYDKETSSAFELGAKGSVAEGKVSLEVAVFHTDVTDMQFFEFFTGGFGLLRVVSNIDEVEIYGLETTFNALVSESWTVFGSAAFNESDIGKNSARPNTEGNSSPYTPDYTLNLGAQYLVAVNDGAELSFRADWRLTGPTWFHTVQDETVRTSFDLFFPGLGTADFSKTKRDSYNTLDLRLELSSQEDWRVALYGLNVFDEDVLSEVIPAAEFGGTFVAPGAGRTLGVEFGYQF